MKYQFVPSLQSNEDNELLENYKTNGTESQGVIGTAEFLVLAAYASSVCFNVLKKINNGIIFKSIEKIFSKDLDQTFILIQ